MVAPPARIRRVSSDSATAEVCRGIIVEKRRTQKHVFLRNEPTVLRRYLLQNKHCIRNLRLKFVKKFGGFVSENEPKSSPFSAAFRPEWIRF